METKNLSAICQYRRETVSVTNCDKKTFISTENMLPNKAGISLASKCPTSGNVSKYHPGDVLVSNIRPYFKKIHLANTSGTCSNDVLVFQPNHDVCTSEYLFCVLSTDDFFSYATTTAKGTKMPRGDRNAIMNYQINWIPVHEQSKIAEPILNTYRKIKLNEQINDNLQKQARSLFNEFFIHSPEGEATLKTELGLFPSNFSVIKTGDLPILITDYVANGSFASLKENVQLYQERNYAYFIRNTDLKSGTFNVFVDEHSYHFLAKSKLFGGEIIVSNVGDVGSVFLCPKLDAPMTLGNNIIMIKPLQEELRYYLYIWFKWSLGQNLIQSIKGGSAQPKFNKTDFKSLPIVLPSKDILEKFHTLVRPIFEAIEQNQAESRTLTRLRDALLQNMPSFGTNA